MFDKSALFRKSKFRNQIVVNWLVFVIQFLKYYWQKLQKSGKVKSKVSGAYVQKKKTDFK